MNPGMTCCEAHGLNITAMEFAEREPFVPLPQSMRFFGESHKRLLIAVDGTLREDRERTASAIGQLLDALVADAESKGDNRRRMEWKVLVVVTKADQPGAAKPEAVRAELTAVRVGEMKVFALGLTETASVLADPLAWLAS